MEKRIPTSCIGLDERMEGGIPEKHIVLVCGPTGSMKTTFAFNMLYHLADVPSIYISLEQNLKSIAKQMNHFGLKFDAKDSNIAITDMGQVRKSLSFLEEKSLSTLVDMFIVRLKEYYDAKILVIDSLDSLYLMLKMENPRNELFHFFEKLRALDLMTILVSEMDEGETQFGQHGCETFLADSILHISKERVGTSMGRLIRVVKMREVKHPTDFFPLIVDNGFKIVTR